MYDVAIISLGYHFLNCNFEVGEGAADMLGLMNQLRKDSQKH